MDISRSVGGVATLTANAPSSVDITANIAVGTGTEAAKDDHVHDLADGSIEAAATFASGVVDATAIAANAVQASEIDQTAEDILFSQFVLNPKTTGSGTTVGTLFYDSDDNRLKIFQ